VITSFKVGAIFAIVDEATPKVERITVAMRALVVEAEKVRTVLESIGASSSGIAAAGTEISSLSRRLSTGTRNADAYAAAMDRTALSARALAASGGAFPPSLPGGGGGRGPGTANLPHGPHFGRIGGSVPVYGGHAHASAPASGGLIAGGIAGYALWKTMHASEDLTDQQDKMRRQGRTEEQIRSITNIAFDDIARQVPTATASEILKSTAELTFTKGNFQSAVGSTAQALKIDALISNATGTKVEGQGFQMYRALEEKLVTQDKAHTDKLLGIMAQGTIATGGRVSGRDWFTFAKRAGVSWINQSDEFVGTTVPTLIQSLGADTAGTAVMTMYQTLMGAGTLSKQQYEAFLKLGLINPDKVTHDKGGRVNVQPGGIVGSLESKGNLAKWGRDFLAPALANVPEDEREAYLAKIGRNRNTTRMFEMFSNPAGIAQFDKDAALIKSAWGIDDSYKTFISKDPKGVTEGLSKQFTSMMEALGGPAMQAAIPAMKGLTSLFSAVAAAANAHQGAAGVVTGILGGVGTGALVGGGIGLLTGGPAGMMVGAGFGAVGGGSLGAAYGLWNNLDSIPSGVKTGALRGAPLGPLGVLGGAALGGMWGGTWNALGMGPAGAKPINATITVKAETDEPNHLAEKIAKLLTEYLSLASKHNQGPGDGVTDSIYNNAVGVP
jgi:hypothetical protein